MRLSEHKSGLSVISRERLVSQVSGVGMQHVAIDRYKAYKSKSRVDIDLDPFCEAVDER